MSFLLALLLVATATAVPDPGEAVVRLPPEDVHVAAMQNDAVLVDVRGEVPYALEHIEGAISIPLGLLADRAAELPKGKLIVTYCACKEDNASIDAVVRLERVGITRAAALRGGLDGWKLVGLPVVKAPPESAPVTVEKPVAAASRGGRYRPPAAVTCDRNHLTSYVGRVTRFKQTKAKTTLRIATDWDTVETVVAARPIYLLDGEPMKAADWKRPNLRRRANVWVCRERGFEPVIDWRPDEPAGNQ